MNEKPMPIPFYIEFVTTKNAIRCALPFERRLKDVQKTFKRRYVLNNIKLSYSTRKGSFN